LLKELVPAIRKTAELVQDVTHTSREQAQGVAQVKGAMTQVDRVTQANAAAAEELSSTGQEMAVQADNLQRLLSFFHLKDSAERQQATPRLRLTSGKSTEETVLPPPQPYPSRKSHNANVKSRPSAAERFSNKTLG
jgi:methyl-accepting chemotaxis protein